MTTFDDRDLFDLVEEAEPASRRRRALLALAVAGLLVVAGLTWLLLARGAGDQEPAMAVDLLSREQQPTDEIPADIAAEAGLDPASARFAVRTAAGQHFAALSTRGDLCLVLVPDADAPRSVCSPPSPAATVTLTAEEEGSRVRLGADDASAPGEADGWRPAGSNVWVLETPPAG